MGVFGGAGAPHSNFKSSRCGRYGTRADTESASRFRHRSVNMLQILGSVVVVGCVLGGFVLEGGHILALWHPTEILIIVGAALGAFMTSNPPKVSKAAFTQALAIPKGPRYKRDDYVTLLKLIYDILMKVRKEGLLAIEA